MITKLKTCDGCNEQKQIWKNHESQRFCQYCWNKKKPPKYMSKINSKRKFENEIYKIEKAEYFKEHPFCEFEGCNSREITIHHQKGRIGKLLYDKRYFKSLCMKHHRFVEENPEKAKELGLSLNRN